PLPVALDEQDERLIVDRVYFPPHSSGVNHRDLRIAPGNGRAFWEAAAGNSLTCRKGVEVAEEIVLVVSGRPPERADAQLVQDREETERMIGMGVGQDGGVERRHSTVEKLGKKSRPSEIARFEIKRAAAVDQDRVPPPA